MSAIGGRYLEFGARASVVEVRYGGWIISGRLLVLVFLTVFVGYGEY